MASQNTDTSNSPLYSSRIIGIFAAFIKRHYPEVDIDSVLESADITSRDVEEPGHWFTQDQVDRFHEVLVIQTGNQDIAKEAGRYAASSEGMGAAKQYTLGLMNLSAVYLSMEKIYAIMSRGADVKTKKIGANKVELTSTPRPGVDEKLYQCENRIGSLESVARLFTKKFAKIEHPSCFHRGDSCCRYIITWEKTRSHVWKLVRNYVLLFSAFSSLVLLFLLPTMSWVGFTVISAFLVIIFSLYSQFLEKKELAGTITEQGDAAKDLLDETTIRYNNAIFVQEIGQAISSILDIDELIRTVVRVMQKRLDLDRGMIMSVNKEKTRLTYRDGYGYDPEMEEILRNTGFHLGNPGSRGVAVQAFKQKKPFLVNDIAEIEGGLSERSREFVRQMRTKSFICVPIVYENESLGLIIVDNVESKRALTESDMNLLMGVASQAAISMANAISFQKLQESEEKYRTILEGIEEGYFEVDLAGNFTFFNDSVCKILGYSRHELMNMNNREYTDPETSARMFKAFNEIYRVGKPLNIMDYTVVRKDGRAITLEMSAYLKKDQAGEPVGFRGIVRDVTEKKQAEEMRQAKLAAEAANRAKSRFLANMSHEIRTPLNGIIGMTELATVTELDGNQRNMIQTIQTESKSLLGIINDILDSSKIEEGMLELEEIPFDLRTMMDNLVNIFAYRARQKDLGINASLAPDVPSGLIGDPGRLRQILKNLIDNAIKFTVKGEIHIEGHVAEDLGDRIKIRFSVKDSGIGIPRERHSTIFDSFTQADSSTTRKYGGTGLGTTISKQLTELMGGEIGVKSQEGKGSTFWFTAVFSRQVVEKPTQARYNERQVFTQEQMGARRKSVHILLVEDYPTNQQVAMNHLKAAGYHVDLAENGLEALALYKERRYDLILMDIQMPVMDGYTATSKIRRLETQRLSGHGTQQQSSFMPHTSLARTWPGRTQDEETEGRDTSEVSPNSGHVAPGRASIKRVPIIAMTAHAITGYRERCLEVGMDDYLAKPLTRREFLAMIEKWTGANDPPPDSPKPDTRVNQPPTVDHHQSKEKTPIDFEKALKEFVGNKTVLMKVLNGFVENARGQIGIIRQAITDGDADRVRREAHSIKGGAANLTAVELSRTAFEMENVGKSGSMERGMSVLKRLEKELNGLDVYISTLK